MARGTSVWPKTFSNAGLAMRRQAMAATSSSGNANHATCFSPFLKESHLTWRSGTLMNARERGRYGSIRSSMASTITYEAQRRGFKHDRPGPKGGSLVAVILRDVPKGINWGWYSRENGRMHLRTVASASSNPYTVWLEVNGKRMCKADGPMPN